MDNENWKIVNGFSNYEVSDMGRVRNSFTFRILKQKTVGDNIRFKVNLYNDRGSKNFMVHRLVAIHFLPNIYGKDEVDHVNRNQQDNRVYNLRWCSSSENKLNTKIRKDNISGVKGVFFDKERNKWRANVKIYKQLHSKRFNTKDEAIEYRNKMVEEVYNDKFYKK